MKKTAILLRKFTRRFAISESGNFAAIFAIAAAALFTAAGVAVDYSNQHQHASRLQEIIDASVLAGASQAGDDDHKKQAAQDYFDAHIALGDTYLQAARSEFSIVDGNTVAGTAEADVPLLISGYFIPGPLQAGVSAAAYFGSSADAGNKACIHVLGDNNQALLVNSGADVSAPNCEIHVHSVQNPAFIMNSGSSLNLKKLCVNGKQYIKNGGYISSLETGCNVESDPYAGTLTEPSVPSNCTTQGAYNPGSHSLDPGVHCWTTFNGQSQITFKPGLHIIKGTMIINDGSVINAQGVTFYFPDTGSEMRVNGGLTMNATAPSAGAYKGVLMFEKTSDAANNANKRQYIFNGSKGEHLEGLIYLPNRDVTYNSTTNVNASNTTLVVNTMIINSANWNFSGADIGSTSNSTPQQVRLLK